MQDDDDLAHLVLKALEHELVVSVAAEVAVHARSKLHLFAGVLGAGAGGIGASMVTVSPRGRRGQARW